jgi:hypothetical protein
LTKKIYLLLPYALVVFFSVSHLCQSIVFSGLAKIPGDMGDARLVNLILEHNWQSFTGKQNLISPSMFYPKEHTIFYTHNLWGTSPLYAIFRIFGLSIETSYQAWFMLICSLNSVCFLFLLRKLNISNTLAVPLTLVGVASGPVVYKCVHPQLLAIFPFFLCLVFLYEFINKPRIIFLYAFVVFYIYQHYCSIYQGVFVTIIIFLLIIYSINKFKLKTINLFNYICMRKLNLLFIISFVLFSLCLLYLPYYQVSKFIGSRHIAELKYFSPEILSWLSASPYSLLYSKLNLLSPDQNAVWEKLYFTGFTGYFYFGLFLFYIVLKKPILNTDLKIALCLIFTFITLIILVSNFSVSKFNLWILLADYFQPLCAIRAFGRIFILLTSIQVIALAILLNNILLKSANNKIIRLIVLFSPFLFVLESLSIGQPEYSKKTAQDRVLGLKESFVSPNDFKAFAYAPGVVLNPLTAHLDAWNLSLITGIPCFNGYSGHTPKTHSKFIASPTKANALELVKNRGFVHEEVSILEFRSPEIERYYPLTRYDLSAVRINTFIKELECHVNQEIILECYIFNPSQLDIPAKRLNFHPSYRIYQSDGQLVQDLEPLRSPVEILSSKKMFAHKLKILTPNSPGNYIIKPSMVREHIEWKVDNLPNDEVSCVRLKIRNAQ